MGEHACQTKPEGELSPKNRKDFGRTLENYCHDIPEKDRALNSKLKEGCPLYPTKPSNVPVSLNSAMEVAEMLASYEEHHNLPSLHELTAWEWCCLDASSQGKARAHNESIPSNNQQTDNPYGIGQGGGLLDDDG